MTRFWAVTLQPDKHGPAVLFVHPLDSFELGGDLSADVWTSGGKPVRNVKHVVGPAASLSDAMTEAIRWRERKGL